MINRGIGRYLLLIAFLMLSVKLHATHIRAAEISAERLSITTYKIKVVLYTDLSKVVGENSSLLDNLKLIVPGGSTIPLVKQKDTMTFVLDSSFATFRVSYEAIYNYNGVNNTFSVGFLDNNRIDGIQNINDAQSVDVPLYIKLTIFNEGCGENCKLNRTPIMLVPAVDQAAVGQVYTHNTGAYDPDGDSLSFRLVTPRRSEKSVVENFKSPADPSFGSGATIKIDPVTGDLTWDKPLKTGIYNVAIEVTEWGTTAIGSYFKSVMVRDMQINVLKSNNIAPEVISPNDTCVEAGKQFTANFKGYDPNGDRLTRSFYGSPTDLFHATFDAADYNYVKDTLRKSMFRWTPVCELVQKEPYQEVFKLSDNHPQSLSTVKSFNIRVRLPAPEKVQTTEQNNQLKITWDSYLCKNTLVKYKLYRSSCDSSSFAPDLCTEGVLSEWGFDLLAEVDKEALSYLDKTVEVGGQYCYVLVAVDKQGNESVVSNQSCGNIGLDLPLLTNVSVETTDSEKGKITVKWHSPLVLDTSKYSGPYRYELYRSEDVLGNNFSATPVATINRNEFSDEVFEFTDSLLNTFKSPYSYRVLFYNNDVELGTSQISSYIRMELEGKFKRAIIKTTSRVEWLFPDSLTQVVYRVVGDSIMPFDTLYGNIDGQEISNLNNGEEYCFFVATKGVFCNPALLDSFVVNNTNKVCVAPNDFNPPCPPTLAVDTLDCSSISESSNLNINTLTWKNNFKIDGCENDIVKYTLYFQPSRDVVFEQLITFDSLTFDYQHYIEDSRAGCYYITATDLSGLTSDSSNVVCNDNCDTISFPNIITPNSDGKNDFFIPMPTPRNVKSIDFEVYNRLGKRIYSSTDNAQIEWSGKNYAGEYVADGMYYYSAIVTFYRLNVNDQQRVYKGWILLQR